MNVDFPEPDGPGDDDLLTPPDPHIDPSENMNSPNHLCTSSQMMISASWAVLKSLSFRAALPEPPRDGELDHGRW